MFFTDWEGPWILTDFALELSMAVFNNERFFSNLSLYDDYLAYEVKREGYEAGYTLKLLAPFLAAANVSNEEVRRIARLTAKFVPDAERAMAKLSSPVVISTSYMQYLEITTSAIGVKGHIHGTEVDFDALRELLSPDARKMLLSMIDRIASLRGEELFATLDELFSDREVMSIMERVKAVGAGEKAKILREYCERYEIDTPIAVGDSISDYKMFEEARKLGGVAVAFNGNEYALKHADIAIVSPTAMSEAIVVEHLLNRGKEAISSLPDLSKSLPETEIYIMADSDFEEVLEKSRRMRVRLRGLAGKLG